MKKLCVLGGLLALALLTACDKRKPTSDDIQRNQQENLLAESTRQVGMPNIRNFRERKLLKQIMELRDQDGLVTYTYLVNEHTGKLRFFGQTVGYGIHYATQFTSPQKVDSYAQGIIAQADPNGLFSPGGADGTWVLMKDPLSDKTSPVYIEPRIIVMPFKAPAYMLEQ